MAGLIEREAVLATLQAACGSGRVALVAGEAGIGKTSVLRVLASAHAARGQVWWGACDALETPHPLAPLQDMARDAAPPVHAVLAAALAGPRPALFEAVLEALRSATRPVLMVVEDAHWADEATLDLLKFLGRRIAGTRALLVVSYRDDEVTASHPLRRVIGELPPDALTRVPLARLSPGGVQQLAQQMGRRADGVHALTRGNAFFVTEVLRDTAEPRGPVPATVQDVVLARLARLPSGVQALLHAVAVVPGRAERWLVDALVSPTLDEIESALADPARSAAPARLVHHAVQARDRGAISLQAPRAAAEAAGRVAQPSDERAGRLAAAPRGAGRQPRRGRQGRGLAGRRGEGFRVGQRRLALHARARLWPSCATCARSHHDGRSLGRRHQPQSGDDRTGRQPAVRRPGSRRGRAVGATGATPCRGPTPPGGGFVVDDGIGPGRIDEPEGSRSLAQRVHGAGPGARSRRHPRLRGRLAGAGPHVARPVVRGRHPGLGRGRAHRRPGHEPVDGPAGAGPRAIAPGRPWRGRNVERSAGPGRAQRHTAAPGPHLRGARRGGLRARRPGRGAGRSGCGIAVGASQAPSVVHR